MKAKEFDEAFSRGTNLQKNLNVPKARRPNVTLKRINVDFPVWVIASLDKEARRLGITRQSLVKMWIAERIEYEEKQAA